MAIEGLKNNQHSQIVMSFYQKNEAKWELYIINCFEQLSMTSKKNYCAIAWIKCKESDLQRKGAWALGKLGYNEWKQQRFVAKIFEGEDRRQPYHNQCFYAYMLQMSSIHFDVTKLDNYMAILNRYSLLFTFD